MSCEMRMHLSSPSKAAVTSMPHHQHHNPPCLLRAEIRRLTKCGAAVASNCVRGPAAKSRETEIAGALLHEKFSEAKSLAEGELIPAWQ